MHAFYGGDAPTHFLRLLAYGIPQLLQKWTSRKSVRLTRRKVAMHRYNNETTRTKTNEISNNIGLRSTGSQKHAPKKCATYLCRRIARVTSPASQAFTLYRALSDTCKLFKLRRYALYKRRIVLRRRHSRTEDLHLTKRVNSRKGRVCFVGELSNRGMQLNHISSNTSS